jgi:superfamily I DNA/RNA helicase
MSNRQPTAEQVHILDLARTSNDNLMLNAYAGCGKTTTLEMIESVSLVKPVLYLCFNKKVADEATKRMASTTTVRTFNSLGHRIWSKHIGKQFKPDPKKIPDMLRLAISETKRPLQSRMWDNFWVVVDGVNKARAIGYIPTTSVYSTRSMVDQKQLISVMDEQPDDFTMDCINAILNRSIASAHDGLCDFNDQIYMPTLFGGTFPEFPLVMVDEWQDLNAINLHMVDKLAKRRLVGVGDPFQSIYAFRGAVSGSMRAAVKSFGMTECDLSISFRCPEAIVRSVHWHVPQFKWIKPGGSVRIARDLHLTDIPDEATFICRNNAPLFKLAMKVLSAGRSVSVVGSDIGPRMLGQMRKLGDSSMTRSQVTSAIDAWLEQRLGKGSKTAKDTADCMRVFADHGDSLGQAISYAGHLFAQKGKLTFTTGHKAKGLEWPHVFCLDSWLCGDTEQDKNLSYVMATRSADKLDYVNSEQVKL